MRTNSGAHSRASRRLVPALGAWVVCVACAANSAPAGFLPKPVEAQQLAFGGWIELTLKGGPRDSARVEGELIAVSADTVWVLTIAGARAVPTASVGRGKLTGYDSESGEVATAVLGGAVMTFTNGAFLVFTAPMWIIGGLITEANQAALPVKEIPRDAWVDLRPFARFPQGMPPGVKIGDLKPRSR